VLTRPASLIYSRHLIKWKWLLLPKLLPNASSPPYTRYH